MLGTKCLMMDNPQKCIHTLTPESYTFYFEIEVYFNQYCLQSVYTFCGEETLYYLMRNAFKIVKVLVLSF